MDIPSGLWASINHAWSKTYVRQSVLVAVLALAIASIQSALFNFANREAALWIAPLDTHSSLCATSQNCFVPVVPITEWEQKRIEEQYQQTCGRAKHHLDVMINLYSNYYVFIVMASLAAVVGGVALVLVAKHGWATASASGLVIVVMMTGAALLYRSLPAVFQQEQNIAENKSLYLEYVALENETRSFAATGEDVRGEKQTAAQFIHHLDDRLAKLNNLALGFNPSKVPAPQDLRIPGEYH
jgi:hypothetical protein